MNILEMLNIGISCNKIVIRFDLRKYLPVNVYMSKNLWFPSWPSHQQLQFEKQIHPNTYHHVIQKNRCQFSLKKQSTQKYPKFQPKSLHLEVS